MQVKKQKKKQKKLPKRKKTSFTFQFQENKKATGNFFCFWRDLLLALAKALFFFLTKIPTEANTKKNVIPWDKTAFSWPLSLWNCSYSELKLKYVRLNLKKSKNCCLHNAIPITWSNYEAFHATLQTRQMLVFTAASSPRIKYSAQNSNFQEPQILKWLKHYVHYCNLCRYKTREKITVFLA